MNYEAVDIRKELQAISSVFSVRADRREIQWFCEIGESIPNEFNTDPRRLKQILMNLIGNSMKFTFKGYVKITAELIQIENKPAIKFSIIDTGLGIKKKD